MRKEMMLFFLGLLMLFVLSGGASAVSVVYPVGNLTTLRSSVSFQYVNGSGDYSVFVNNHFVKYLHGGNGSFEVPLSVGDNVLQLRSGGVPVWSALIVRKLFSTAWLVLSILWFISFLTAILIRKGLFIFVSIIFALLMVLMSLSGFSLLASFIFLALPVFALPTIEEDKKGGFKR